MILPFTKCQANGNDFILTLADDFPKETRSVEIIRRLCCRYTGIGANGLFIVSPSNEYDFMLDYYNSDGSWETLCANGSRCAVQFMYQSGCIENKTVFLAGDGPHLAKILENGTVCMQMKTPEYQSSLLSPEGCNGYFIDSGARHFVSESVILEDDFVSNAGRKIRYSHIFQPEGMNVNFYRLIDKHLVEVKTYEKGIEEVMLSCSSGSAAVVFHLAKNKCVQSPVIVSSTGGSVTVNFDKTWSDVWMEGPAEIVFTGHFTLDEISK